MFRRILLWLFMLGLCHMTQAAKQEIVVLGDSISAAYGIEISKGWVALLIQQLQARAIPIPVYNVSISGSTTSSARERLSSLLVKYPKAIFIVELGGNDGLQGVPLTLIEKNLADIIQTLKKKQHPILLVGIRLPPNYGDVYNDAFVAIYQRISKKYHVPLVPLILKTIDENPNLMQSDGIHPNEKAQAQILKNIWEKLEPLLMKT